MASAFFGLVIKGGNSAAAKIPEMAMLSLSQVALTNVKDNQPVKLYCTVEQQKFIVCTLNSATLPQQSLSLTFFFDQPVSFSVEGNGDIHLIGYLQPLGDDSDLSEGDSQDDESAFAYANGEIPGGEDDDSDDENDDDDDNDGVDGSDEIGPGRHPRVEELQDEENGVDDAQSKKRKIPRKQLEQQGKQPEKKQKTPQQIQEPKPQQQQQGKQQQGKQQGKQGQQQGKQGQQQGQGEFKCTHCSRFFNNALALSNHGLSKHGANSNNANSANNNNSTTNQKTPQSANKNPKQQQNVPKKLEVD